jgi:DNA-binding protein HU-beta
MPPKRAKASSKTQMISDLADASGVSKKEVKAVLSSLSEFAIKELRAGRPFQIPHMVVIEVKNKPARPARQGRNPKTGAPITIKARGPSKALKARVRKNLKTEVL